MIIFVTISIRDESVPEKYEEELKQERELAKTKRERLERKQRKEKYWEMLRWVVKFIDDNKEQWEEEKKMKKTRREHEEKKETWEIFSIIFFVYLKDIRFLDIFPTSTSCEQ